MPNPLCHFELMVDDPSKARAFYEAVFDWTFDDASMPGYTLIQTGAEPTGGMFKRPELAPGVCANIYFQTHDLDATLSKAVERGAKVLVPKTAIPNVGHFAMITDPEGIPVGLMQPN
ncbi:MAG: VOC family protein [Phycisphaerae bacterium]|nr:VOC family protein [Phycisphaerae bacterium]